MRRVTSLDCEEWDECGVFLRSEVSDDGPPSPEEGRIAGGVGCDDDREHCASFFFGSGGCFPDDLLESIQDADVASRSSLGCDVTPFGLEGGYADPPSADLNRSRAAAITASWASL